MASAVVCRAVQIVCRRGAFVLLVVSFVACLAIPTSAVAQSLKLPLTVYAGASALDLHSTYTALQYEGVVEKNPLGTWLSEKPATLVVFSAATDATTVYLLHRLIGKRHPRVATVALYSVAALRVGLAAYNYHGLDWQVKKRRCAGPCQ